MSFTAQKPKGKKKNYIFIVEFYLLPVYIHFCLGKGERQQKKGVKVE